MTSNADTAARLTAKRISALTGLTGGHLRRLEHLGVLAAGDDGYYGSDAVDRVALACHAISRGIDDEQIGRFCRDHPELMASLLANRPTAARAYTLEEAVAEVADDMPDQAFLDAMLDLVGPARGDPLNDEDIAAIRMANHALRTGLPGDALLQLIRVMAEAVDRVADAENRVFHDYVHEHNRAQGLRGRELFDATESVSRPLLAMAEPALLYLHRRALHRAMRDDFVRHLTEATRPPVERPGEAPATMLFIDLAGFTPLTLTMGDDAAADVLSRFASIVRSAVVHRHGRIVKQIGDAFMLVFNEPVDAVRFGIDVSAAVVAESHFPPVHLGAHHGSVLFRDGDYIGTTVNLAARVAGATEPGQFLVTSEVAEAVRGGDGIQLTPMPPTPLKGIETATPLFDVNTLSHDAADFDPVCGMAVRPGNEAERATIGGRTYRFCSRACYDKFVTTQPTV